MIRFTLFTALALLPLAAQDKPGALTPAQWREDVAYLAKELPARHIKYVLQREDPAAFRKLAGDLEARIPELNDRQVLAGILKLVASAGDAHTAVRLWQRGDLRYLPLTLYWFQDGIFVLAAPEEHRALLGARLERIGRMSVAEACRVMTALLAHENEAQLKSELPNLLIATDLLEPMGVIPAPDRAVLEVVTTGGERLKVELAALPRSAPPRFVQAYAGEQPLYRRNQRKPYWATLIDGGRTVYFQYNVCTDSPQSPFAEMRAELKKMLAGEGVRRLVVDLRINSGGNSAVLDPWIDEIKRSPFNRKGRLYVIIGRRTFSSAILNALRLRDETAATLAGEPTGGRPNHYGEVRSFTLPNSRLTVTYSVKYFKQSAEDTPSLVPHVLVEQTSKDFLAGADPVLDAILRAPLP